MLTVKLTHYTEEPLLAIEEAASNCYDSEPTKTGRIAQACYKSGHQAVLEFATFHFHIEGVSRALLAQITRHRMASFAVRSQRYVKELNFDYVTPTSIIEKGLVHEFADVMEYLSFAYYKLLKAGIPPEDARFVLPNACSTVIDVEMNLRELMHFMNERLCARAQWEIRELAQEMRRCVLAVCPELAPYLVPKCEVHGDMPFCTEIKTCGKHPRLKEIYDAYTA